MFPEGIAQIIVRQEEIRLEAHRPLILRNRFVEESQLIECSAQVVAHLGDVGLDQKNGPIDRDGIPESPGTMFSLC